MERRDGRKSFYSAVCKTTQPDPNYTWTDQPTTSYMSMSSQTGGMITPHDPHMETKSLRECVGDALAALVARVGTVLLHFDEAHFLMLITDDGTAFGVGVGGLMSAMADLAQFTNHVVVLTSTDIKMSPSAPPVRWPSSAPRMDTNVPDFPQLFTTLSFNLFELKPSGADPLCPSQVRTTEIARKLGRPL
jgi:hypothetical protein